jgi:hypothetical protein
LAEIKRGRTFNGADHRKGGLCSPKKNGNRDRNHGEQAERDNDDLEWQIFVHVGNRRIAEWL